MTWWAILPPLLVALVVVVVPGLIVAYAATGRGITAWGLAPALSLTTFTVVGLVFGLVHIPWELWTVIPGVSILVVLVVIAGWVIGRRSKRSRSNADPRRLTGIALSAVLLAAIVIGARFAIGFASPDAVSQTFDANFHLNGVRYILSSGDANPLTFSNLGNPGGAFYPNLWHMLAAFVVAVGGSSIPVATNALAIVIGGVVWPLSCVFLVRQLVGVKVGSIVAAALISTCFAAFPQLLVTFGVLYPNLLSLALLPAAFGAFLIAIGVGREAPLSLPAAWLATLAVVPAVALAHPNGIISLVVIAIPLWVLVAFRHVRQLRQGTAKVSLGASIPLAVLVVAGYITAFIVLRPPAAAATWSPTLGPWRATFDAAVNAQLGPPAIAMTILVVGGMVSVFLLRRQRWLVASALVVDFFYVATAYLPVGALRYWVTGTWYSDVYRLIALGPLVLVPLAALGATWFGSLGARALRGRLHGPRALASTTVIVALIAAIAANAGPAMMSMSRWTAASYRLDRHSPLLTTDERAVLERVPQFVPAGGVVAGDPWTGTAMVWALGDRKALTPAIYGGFSPATTLILRTLRTATFGSEVCKAVKAEHVDYVLDFGTDGVFGPTDQYPGVHHLESSSAVTKVFSVGRAALYRISGCG
jgi:hypothetical protein